MVEPSRPSDGILPKGPSGPSLKPACGEREHLQHLELKNVPGLLDPSAFAGLISLRLADGVRTRYTEVIAFLRSSNTLLILHFINVRWLDHMRAPSLNDPELSLQQLRELTLVESLEHTGLINLLYVIDIQSCIRLHLHTLGTVELLGQRLAEKVAPFVGNTLETQTHTSLDIHHHLTANEMSWEGQETSGDCDVDGERGFHIGFSSDNPSRSDRFFNFVKRVLDLAGQITNISLNIHDSLSGTTRLGPNAGATLAVPTFSVDIPRRLGITNVSMDVVEGYLGYVKDLLIHQLRPNFPRLSTVHLRYLPDSEAAVQPCSWAKHSLDALLNNLLHVYQDVEWESDLFEEVGVIITLSSPSAMLPVDG